MVNISEIDAALAAHAAWKKRLMDAITSGTSEFTPDIVERDNACQFGKWLHGLSEEDTGSEDYRKVKELHAGFHRTAAEILRLALSGAKDEALKKISSGGPYPSISGKLVLALQNWKSKI